jgi:inorganic pyrophosphatase/exopolyphosphatase
MFVLLVTHNTNQEKEKIVRLKFNNKMKDLAEKSIKSNISIITEESMNSTRKKLLLVKVYKYP